MRNWARGAAGGYHWIVATMAQLAAVLGDPYFDRVSCVWPSTLAVTSSRHDTFGACWNEGA